MKFPSYMVAVPNQKPLTLTVRVKWWGWFILGYKAVKEYDAPFYLKPALYVRGVFAMLKK